MKTNIPLRNRYLAELLTNVVPFWLRHGLDGEYGGIQTCLDQTGKVLDSDKGVWQQGRFAWLMSKLYNTHERNDSWLAAAKSTIEFLDQFGCDSADGRMWFQLTRTGQPLRKRRYAFSESFAAIAYAQYAKATASQVYADKAIHFFKQFVNVARCPQPPKFTATRPSRSLSVPMITLVTAQELREAIGFSDADRWIDQSIDEIVRYHMKDDRQCVLETVGPNGEFIDHFDGRTLNPGHAIEAAWFIMWEGRWRRDQQMIQTGIRILEWMWQRGWDQTHGGLLYFVDVDGGPCPEYWHDMKFWWPHNEAIIACLLAYLLTGDEKFARWHEQVDAWSFEHFPDRQHGEWFGYLHRDGSVSSTIKGNLWKGAFHLPRMLLVCAQLLEQPDRPAE